MDLVVHNDWSMHWTHRGTEWRRTVAKGLLAVALCVSCVVSPVPQPPNIDPPELDVTGMEGLWCENCDQPALSIVGPPGAVTHPEVTGGLVVWVVDLDRTNALRSVEVAEDGSFVVHVEGGSFDVFRLQARVEIDGVMVRSSPVDVTFEVESSVARVLEHPLAECFEVEPWPEHDFGAASRGDIAQVEVRNLCDELLIVDLAALRAPSDAFAVVGEPPTRVEPRSAVIVELELIAEEPGMVEAILNLSVSGPDVDRRDLTLFALVE